MHSDRSGRHTRQGRTLCALLLLVLLLPGWPGFSPPAFGAQTADADSAAPTTSAQAAILMSADGDVLYSKNADARLPMASTTKIMTALVVSEHTNPEQVITVPAEAVGVEGSSAYLIRSEQLTVKDLLYALLLQSANDAAETLAVAVGGSVEGFAALMNEKAAELGLVNTHFTNPHGLDDEAHYTSAADLAVIAAGALENETLSEIMATKQYVSTSLSGITRYFTNHNRLLWSYEGAIGMKTGYTMRTGRCLVSAARRDGLTLIAVTLRDPSDWQDHKRMLDYGFSRYEKVKLAAPGQISDELPLIGGTSDRVRVSNRDAIELWLPKGTAQTVQIVIERRDFDFAPIPAQKACGRAVFLRDGREIGSLPLYAEQEVAAKEIEPTFWQKVGDFFLGILRLIGRLFAKKHGVG